MEPTYEHWNCLIKCFLLLLNEGGQIDHKHQKYFVLTSLIPKIVFSEVQFTLHTSVADLLRVKLATLH